STTPSAHLRGVALATTSGGDAVTSWFNDSYSGNEMFGTAFDGSKGLWEPQSSFGFVPDDDTRPQRISLDLNERGDRVLTWVEEANSRCKFKANYYSAETKAWRGPWTLIDMIHSRCSMTTPKAFIDNSGDGMLLLTEG